MSYRRLYFRAISRGKIKNIAHKPIYHSPFTLDELFKFLGILLYSAEYPTNNFENYWNNNNFNSPFHGTIQLTMSCLRFKLMYKSFRFTQQEVFQILNNFFKFNLLNLD